MTLPELLPSLRSSLPPHLDPDIWPLTAQEGQRAGVLRAPAGEVQGNAREIGVEDLRIRKGRRAPASAARCD